MLHCLQPDCLFCLFGPAGMNWGVWGAGLAATISQWVSCTILVTLMFHRKLLSTADLVLPPQWQEVVPYLWKGAVLAFRMLVTFGELLQCGCGCGISRPQDRCLLQLAGVFLFQSSKYLYCSLHALPAAACKVFICVHSIPAVHVLLLLVMLGMLWSSASILFE